MPRLITLRCRLVAFSGFLNLAVGFIGVPPIFTAELCAPDLRLPQLILPKPGLLAALEEFAEAFLEELELEELPQPAAVAPSTARAATGASGRSAERKVTGVPNFVEDTNSRQCANRHQRRAPGVARHDSASATIAASPRRHADVAQLVERDLPKVDVASSSLVIRSITGCRAAQADSSCISPGHREFAPAAAPPSSPSSGRVPEPSVGPLPASRAPDVPPKRFAASQRLLSIR